MTAAHSTALTAYDTTIRANTTPATHTQSASKHNKITPLCVAYSIILYIILYKVTVRIHVHCMWYIELLLFVEEHYRHHQ
jgi:hypothetical protein